MNQVRIGDVEIGEGAPLALISGLNVIELVESGPPKALRLAAFGLPHMWQISPQPGSWFSNWEKDEPTYCTVKLANRSRPLFNGSV